MCTLIWWLRPLCVGSLGPECLVLLSVMLVKCLDGKGKCYRRLLFFRGFLNSWRVGIYLLLLSIGDGVQEGELGTVLCCRSLSSAVTAISWGVLCCGQRVGLALLWIVCVCRLSMNCLWFASIQSQGVAKRVVDYFFPGLAVLASALLISGGCLLCLVCVLYLCLHPGCLMNQYLAIEFLLLRLL